MTTPPPPDAARAAFEAWLLEEHAADPCKEMMLYRNNSGKYAQTYVQGAWLGFRAAYQLMAKDAERLRWLYEHMKITPFPKDGWGDDNQRGAVYLTFRNNSIRLEFGGSAFLPNSIEKAIDWAIENPGVPDDAANAAMSAVKGEKG